MDANERLHHEWIGMAQPEGLLVTASTLKAAEANVSWPVTELQETLRGLAVHGKRIYDLRGLFREVLGWSDELVVSGNGIPARFVVAVEGSEPLGPTFALMSADGDDACALLVRYEDAVGAGFDAASDDQRWTATPHQKFERLLRETGVAVGLLTDGRDFRVLYAPKGENAGHVTFRLADMLTVDGRPLLGAFHMLLNEGRLLTLEPERRLLGLLKASREYQNTVSNALREQVLSALRELLLGFQHADRVADGALLGAYRRGHLDEVYKGLVTVLMRSVFVLFAEEQNLLPMDRELYAGSYSLTRLYAQLLEDRDRHGDALDDRYGAWARVITLFRLLHDGVRASDGTYIPARRGDFFDPDAYPFLEGRVRGDTRQARAVLEVPRVSDGVVLRMLDQLLVLGGERLRYKGLDVEQVGSVYEGLMGFELQVAEGDSLALMPEHVVVDLEALLVAGGAERLKRLKADANLDLKDKAAAEVRGAGDVAALHAALGRRVSARQPGLIARGGLYLQPGQERRKTGSHYTPKSLTSPIVETTLRPVLERLGPDVTPAQLLDLCICDPAMGSGAFLVETCRQLADHLVSAWRRTGTAPALPPDEDLVLHARRLVAQQCLYGVDKNPLAVDLARLSLWLVTFAREHAFTFVDHALRCGDSLVGLSREQIVNLSLDVAGGWKQIELTRAVVDPKVAEAERLRGQIHAIGDPPDDAQLKALWEQANEALRHVRLLGDVVVAAFFSADGAKERRKAFEEVRGKVEAWLQTGAYEAELVGMAEGLREAEKPVEPFHWEIEFPEVFTRVNAGFDCFVGNPPFLGGTLIGGRLGLAYHDFLVDTALGSTGLADVIAFFFRMSFSLLRETGTFGLLATNTVAQGDTRSAGLEHIVRNGGLIYEAKRRMVWPGAAAVVVSAIHATRAASATSVRLDGVQVERVSPFLLRGYGDSTPVTLGMNRGKAYVGSKVWGAGFVFESTPAGGSSSIDDMNSMFEREPRSRDVVFAYMGGEEFNASPTQTPCRFVIDFGERGEEQAKAWPSAFAIVEERVRPIRAVNKQRNYRENWWLHVTRVPEATEYLRQYERVVAFSKVSKHLAAAFVSKGTIISDRMLIVLDHTFSGFGVVQSRIHEAWARLIGTTMKDDLSYTVDCFETFPVPRISSAPKLELSAESYYSHRAATMLENDEGLTKTYNRFHNPDEPSAGILKLRDLHAQMDRAVLDAYGWQDIHPVYDFREQLDESIRYTWDDDTRDEVLARLLELNRVIAAREAEEAAAQPRARVAPRKAKKQPKTDDLTGDLFGGGDT